MKHFILMFITVMFLANSFAVSVWAKPCINMDMQPSIDQSIEKSNMPCHAGKGLKSSHKNCEGLCLCLHASINQISILNNPPYLNAAIITKQILFNENDQVSTILIAPPYRPPKLNA